MSQKYYLIFDKEQKKIRNPKGHPILFKYFLNKYEVFYLSSNELSNFLNINNKENINLIYYHVGMEYKTDNNYNNIFINFIKNNNLKINILIFTCDFWIHKYKNSKYPSNLHVKKYDKFIFDIFDLNNIKIITFCNNKEQLEFYHQKKYNNNNIIFNNIWCCYDESFIDFNVKPIFKLLISGVTASNFYPERFILSKISKKYNKIKLLSYNENDIKTLNNNYNKTLNKYFACFNSNVYVPTKNIKDNKHYNTNILLLKTFEIIASGSLLVMPKSSEKILNNIGLYHNINCYLINFDENIIPQIENIFNNIEKYNNVRKKAQELAKEKFTFDIKLKEIKKII